jgi:hypothetical protein
MSEKRISGISCPKCGKRFKRTQRTKKQWRINLIEHLMISDNLKPEEASSIADRYLKSL